MLKIKNSPTKKPGKQHNWYFGNTTKEGEKATNFVCSLKEDFDDIKSEIATLRNDCDVIIDEDNEHAGIITNRGFHKICNFVYTFVYTLKNPKNNKYYINHKFKIMKKNIYVIVDYSLFDIIITSENDNHQIIISVIE